MEAQYQISYCYHGKMQCEPAYFWGPGIKEQYKLLFIHNGRGEYHFNGRTYNLEKGQGFAVYPEMICFMKADDGDPWFYSWIAFEGRDAETLLENALLDRDNPVFDFSQPAWFDAYLQEFDSACKKKNLHGLALQSTLYRFFADWLDTMMVHRNPVNSSSSKERYVNQSIEYIRMNYYNSVSISEIARIVGIDRVYLSTLFKEKMSVSPQKYLLQFRMNKACELLGNRNLSIADVSRSVGYGDPLLFSKMFKKVTGLSPSHFRERLHA